jgi:hypothetical protein
LGLGRHEALEEPLDAAVDVVAYASDLGQASPRRIIDFPVLVALAGCSQRISARLVADTNTTPRDQ